MAAYHCVHVSVACCLRPRTEYGSIVLSLPFIVHTITNVSNHQLNIYQHETKML